MKANKKKIIILVSLVLLLVATGVLNYFLTVKNLDEGNNPVDAESTFFTNYRTERTNTRAEGILYLEDIIASVNSDKDTVAAAQAKKLKIVDDMELELTLEGLIKAKGFSDCVVTISSANVNVVVMDADLTVEEAAQILNIIVTETSYTAGNVIVIPYV